MCDIWNRCRFAVNEIKTPVSKFTVKQNLVSFNFTSGRFNHYYDLFLYLFTVFIFFIFKLRIFLTGTTGQNVSTKSM